jgi:hypothetical protein
MRIAIFGSDWSKSPVEAFSHVDEFESTCRSLAERLATSRHVVMVESDGKRTADIHVVEAIDESGHREESVVEAWYRTKTKASDKPIHEPFPNLDWVVKRPVPVTYVGSAHLHMLRNADVAVIIGGGRNAYLAGQAARAMDVRLIPIAAFGGAGRLLWSEVRQEVGPSNAKEMDRDRFRLLDTLSHVVDAVVDEINSLPRIMIVHGRSEVSEEICTLVAATGATAFRMIDTSQIGGTIPEEFERLARSADGAVVVITPDDVGQATLAPGGKPKMGERQPQARQNVVLEYGWFWCRFGRSRVLPLVQGKVELPSDMLGLLKFPFTEVDDYVEAGIREFVGRL